VTGLVALQGRIAFRQPPCSGSRLVRARGSVLDAVHILKNGKPRVKFEPKRVCGPPRARHCDCANVLMKTLVTFLG
jgi:hypothetical protein